MNSTPVAELPAETLALLRRHNLLVSLLRAELIAEAVGSIPMEPEQSAQLLQNYCAGQQLESAEELNAHLQQLSLSRADLQWQLELPLRTQAYGEQHFRHKAEARFLARKEQLDRVVYSLLRVKDGGLARELYLRISGGEANFADLAHSYAEGPERNTKGIVGPVPLNQAHPALAERLRTSSPGELLAPFQIQEWWLVARLESYTPARFDEAIAEQMAAELFEEWVQQETAGILNRLNQVPEHSGEQLPPV